MKILNYSERVGFRGYLDFFTNPQRLLDHELERRRNGNNENNEE